MKHLVQLIIFSGLFLISVLANGGEFKTLIDFSTYEERNQKEDIYVKDDETFREKIFKNPRSIKSTEQISINDQFIPWFKITPKDMSLNRWVVELIYRKGDNSPLFILTQRAFSPFYKEKGKNIKMLGARIHFPHIQDEISASVSPPFEIYPYNQKGKLSNLGNGILNNVGDIEKISLTLGFKGKVNNNSVFLKLEDHLGKIHEYPLGFIYSRLKGQIIYYKDYDGRNFKKENEITKEETLKTSLYYKVYYKGGQADLWVMFKNQRELYHQVTLKWINSNYLPPKKKNVKRHSLYPKEVPFIKFHTLIIRKQDENSGRQFYLFIKDIKIKYDLFIPEEDFTVDDDDAWAILEKFRKSKRKNLEKIHALRIYNMMKEGWAKGFSTYKDFLKYYFLRFPPKKN